MLVRINLFFFMVFFLTPLNSMQLSSDIVHNRIQPYFSLEEIARFKQVSQSWNKLYDPEQICPLFSKHTCSTYACLRLAKNYYACTKVLVHFAHKKKKKKHTDDEKKFRHLWLLHQAVRDKVIMRIFKNIHLAVADQMTFYKKHYSTPRRMCKHIIDEGHQFLFEADTENAKTIFTCGDLNLFDLLEKAGIKKESLRFDEYIDDILCSVCILNNLDLLDILCGGLINQKVFTFIIPYASSNLIINLINNDMMPIDITDESKKSLLHYAAEYGHDSVIPFIFDKGGYVNCIDNKGKTPLHYAIQYGKIRAVYALTMQPDIDMRFTTYKGKQALDYSKNFKLDNPEVRAGKQLIRAVLKPYFEQNKRGHQYGKVHSNGYQKLQ